MQKIEIGGMYGHYKGLRVKILGEGFHSETLEPLIFYMHLEDGVMWARPKKMFFEIVVINGKKIQRFKKIKQKILIMPKRKNMVK
jgi:hypothetical protein